MKPEQMTEALEAAATQLGVRIRYESLATPGSGTGGLCRLKGEWFVIIDKRTTPSERTAILADALSGLDTDGVFLPPQVRDVVQSRRAPARK
jgi:hypothetical protein